MKLEQSFEVSAPLERVWQTLIDVEHVAPCLPGAAVTGRNDDGSYNGTFTVKIGPTTASYTGRLEMENVDEASHSATMQAQGTDKRGQGGAKATIYSRVVPADGAGTRVDVVTDYHITGRLARFGRGGMIEDISERLLREFAKRLQSSLATEPEPAATPEPVSPVEAAPAGQSEVGSAAGYTGQAGSASGYASQPSEMPPPPSPAAPDEVPAPAAQTPFAADAPAPPAETPAPADVAVPGPVSAGLDGPTEPAPPPPPSPGPPPVVTPPPPPASPPPPPGAAGRPWLEHPPQPAEPLQGLSLVGGVVWGRVKRNPAPAAAAGVAVMLLLARRRRKRHAWG